MKTNNEVSTIALAEQGKSARSPLIANLRAEGFHKHADLGSVERMRHTIEGRLRAIQLDVQARTKIRSLPGRAICPLLAWHSGWGVVPRSGMRYRECRTIFGKQYDDDITKCIKFEMGRTPHATEKRSQKLESV